MNLVQRFWNRFILIWMRLQPTGSTYCTYNKTDACYSVRLDCARWIHTVHKQHIHIGRRMKITQKILNRRNWICFAVCRT